ncbi:O-antigen ligase family protein, partial [Roseisolibacter sp. H3M3-2]|uniref:O-antigen ligase family protein n=1 Tax=Roseisolibacter sp. H3M3-2 TaxID=3031323 RepID=UPI0023DB92FC
MTSPSVTAFDPRLAGAVEPRVSPLRGYWRHSAILAVLLTAVVGARAHELIPILPKVRPALVMAAVGGFLALTSTSPAVRRTALGDPLFKLPAAYFGWAALTAPFALWVGMSIKGLQGAVPALVACLVILLCEPTQRTVERLQRGFVLGCALTAVLAQTRGYSTDGRLTTGASLDSNDLAAVMALVVPLCAGLVARARNVMKLLWGGVLATLIGTLVMTGSRGGVIAIVVSTAVYVAGQPGRRRVLYALGAVLAATTAYSMGSATFKERMTSFFVEGQQDYNYTDWTGRRAVWQRARGYFVQSPVIGVGFQNFPVAEGETCKRMFPGRGCKWSDTHNAYLQAASELGLPGIGLFVAMLVAGARRAFPMWRSSAARAGRGAMHRPEFLAAMSGFAASATFLSHAYFYLMFALLALIALASRTAARVSAPVAYAPGEPPVPVRRGVRGGGSFAPGFRGGLARVRA